MTDFDNPWKESLDLFLGPAMQLLFPQIAAEIDWSRGYDSLDKELQQIAPDSAAGPRVADKLYRVWKFDASPVEVFLHAEIQADRLRDFAERVYWYNMRIRDHMRRPVVSLAILCDDNPGWKPGDYVAELWGCGVRFTFPVVKILDFAGRRAELEASDNPFSLIVLATLEHVQSGKDVNRRATIKFSLARLLLLKEYDKVTIRQLLRLLDWIVALPPELEVQFWSDVQTFQKESQVPFVDIFERKAIEKGLEQGRERGLKQGLEQGYLVGIETALQLKFGDSAGGLLDEVRALGRAAPLLEILRSIRTASTPDDVRRIWRDK